MNPQDLKNEIEQTINDSLEIITLRKLQVKKLQDFIKNEELRLEHFEVQLAEIGYEKSK